MNQTTKNIISFLLVGIIITINLAEVVSLIHHFEKHQIENQSIAVVEHKDCKAFCSHILNQDNHQACHGHFLNFMPQIEFSPKMFYSNHPTDLAMKQAIFFNVKQYSSSYTHLFTSRPPPFIS